MLDGLYEKLNAYAQTNFYPFHMPGHKRNPESGPLASFYRLDITEIDGFDNLHEASGVIQQAQERAARLYGADQSLATSYRPLASDPTTKRYSICREIRLCERPRNQAPAHFTVHVTKWLNFVLRFVVRENPSLPW